MIELLKFKKEDFPEYKSWYTDAELMKRLGPMDNEWLEYILNEIDGCQYSAFLEYELIGVVGVKFPTEQNLSYYITDFAIKPNRREEGIGSQVLCELLKEHSLKLGQTWKTFVDDSNTNAKAFFQKNGWKCASKEPDEHGMLLLEYSQPQ